VANFDAVLIGSQRVTLPAAVRDARPGLQRYRDRPFVVGIRPEDLSTLNGDTSAATLQGDVELVESLGAEQLVHFATDAKMIHTEGTTNQEAGATELTEDVGVARIEPRHRVSAGERITFALEPERLEFFDSETGLSIVT
jgi:multiple sugar transport system ATP-binding protein